MKNYSLRKIFSIAGQSLAIGLLSLSVGCKDEPARLTGDVLPDGEKIKGLVYDEHEIGTRNIKRESVRTSDATFGIIGKFDDPVFGSSEAAFLTDFSIGKRVAFSIKYIDGDDEQRDTVLYQFNNNNEFDFPNDTWEVDSLVLNLQYQFNNWYGEMKQAQTVNVYELESDLGSVGKEYFSDHDVDGMYNINPIASKAVYPNSEVPDSMRSVNWSNLYQYPDSLWNYPQYLWDNDKVKASKDSSWLDSDFNGNTTKTKTWSFKLRDDVRDRFFDMSENELKSTAAFKGVFSGVYVALDDIQNGGNGWLAKTNLLSSSSVASNLTLHLSRDYKYLNTDSVIRDTTAAYSYTFPINLENVRFNTYKHELETANIDTTDATPDRLYIQGMAGSYMRMQLPDEVINWVDSIGDPANADPSKELDYRLVSNIEFLMEIDTVSSNMDYYPAPSKLQIKWLDDKGKLEDPVYPIEINGNKISIPVFGRDVDGDGSLDGVGERVIRYSKEGRPEYVYRFIMRAEYFNYIMREEDGAALNEKQFFVGPESTTSNFQRVVLFGGANESRPLKMNIKYFLYRPR
ncbi:DUF4270 family protein [Carboxylicivirga sediminis]|uniref:DUF4270 family protein n=1 Tax=Carboxylicivirga sediminis TaxID=2006564 RepID=A0A941J043_9BACT|nr:DUF4270 family protein [Carboxylicivirga sediminis]MBR8537162.1 DUF4270 family protein [Carboxylicivirga sediminis]